MQHPFTLIPTSDALTFSSTTTYTMDIPIIQTPSNNSPPSISPEFDLSLPCRFFKSEFARKLSLNNTSSASMSQCRSLDFDINNRYERVGGGSGGNDAVNINNKISTKNQIKQQYTNVRHINDDNDATQPPAIPARHSLSSTGPQVCKYRQQQQQRPLPQFRHSMGGFGGAIRNMKQAMAAQNVALKQENFNRILQQIKDQQQQQHHINNSGSCNSNNSSNNDASVSNSGGSNSSGCNHIVKSINNDDFNTKNIWSRGDNIEQDYNFNDDVTEVNICTPTTVKANISMMGSLKSPFEIPHHLLNNNNDHHHHRHQPHHDPAIAVETVLLQNQVDTLQFQLKQAETSRGMYHAVMVEVVRFFDRYHNQQLQKQQHQLHQQQQQQKQRQSRSAACNNNHTEQIPRSKSLFQVYCGGGGSGSGSGGSCDGADTGDGHGDDDKIINSFDDMPPSATARTSSSYLRTRSTTNLASGNPKQPSNNSDAAEMLKMRPKSGINHNHDDIGPSGSYNAFKDFTWRRTPKKHSESNLPIDDAEEKLTREAFRLSRTIQNLLNTSNQQPDLTQHRNSLNFGGRLSGKMTPAASTLTLNGSPLHNSTTISNADANSNNIIATSDMPAVTSTTTPDIIPPKCNNLASTAEILFMRAVNSRESRLSLRSSTDSSVHSITSSAASSSSKMETDEEPAPFHNGTAHTISENKHVRGNRMCSTTEDESGFSSISSSQDINITLSSTLVPDSSLNSCNDDNFSVSSRNSTLKAVDQSPKSSVTSIMAAMHPNNVVGVPLQPTVQQHRCNGPSKTYRNANKLQRFSTLSATDDDSATVLWV